MHEGILHGAFALDEDDSVAPRRFLEVLLGKPRLEDTCNDLFNCVTQTHWRTLPRLSLPGSLAHRSMYSMCRSRVKQLTVLLLFPFSFFWQETRGSRRWLETLRRIPMPTAVRLCFAENMP